MLYKLNYVSRKNKDNVFNGLVRYEGQKYNNYPVLKIKYIHSCTEEYLKNVKIGDSFILTHITEENLSSFISISLFEWISENNQKHYNFDIYHNYDNTIPNTTLVKIN